MAEYVNLRHPATGEVIERPKRSVRFFVNQGFEVLDAAGRKKAQQPAPASSAKKDS